LTGNLYSAWSSGNYYNAANESSPIAFPAPLVAFGSAVGGSTLYLNKSYSFRANFGVIGGGNETRLRIKAYSRTNGALIDTQILTIPSETNTISFQGFVSNGLSGASGNLQTHVQFDSFGQEDTMPSYWYTPLLITHT